MTFGQFILRLRGRLQDLRASDGSVITSFTVSGLRWSSAEIFEIANQSFQTAARLIQTYSNSPIMRQLGTDNFIAKTTGTTDSAGALGISDNYLFIPDLSDATRAYGYISPETYHEYLRADSAPRQGEYFYTVMRDISANTRKIYILPAAIVAVGFTVIYAKADYGSSNETTGLHLTGIDAFLLDLAEMEARDREHNWDRSQILNSRIALSLGVKNG